MPVDDDTANVFVMRRLGQDATPAGGGRTGALLDDYDVGISGFFDRLRAQVGRRAPRRLAGRELHRADPARQALDRGTSYDAVRIAGHTDAIQGIGYGANIELLQPAQEIDEVHGFVLVVRIQ